MIKPDAPIRIGQKICKNRITMAPTVKFCAGQDGLVTDFFAEHYALRARHGCGLVCVEATAVAPEGRLAPTQLGLWDDAQTEGHRRIADACHAYGALVMPQIHYGGLGTHPECGPLTSPTAVMWNSRGKQVMARELTVPEIRRIERRFIDAAVRAKAAGYDGVQLHGCHSYLINDFASDVNRRSDEYGGNTENRARLGCEIISGIREACGGDFIISVRVSGCDPTVEESIRTAEYYVKVAELGVRFHEHFRGIVPVSAVNGIRTPEIARFLLENELADTVDLACGLLADPALAEAILHGTPYIRCFGCKRCGWGPGHPHICPALKKRGDETWEWETAGKG